MGQGSEIDTYWDTVLLTQWDRVLKFEYLGYFMLVYNGTGFPNLSNFYQLKTRPIHYLWDIEFRVHSLSGLKQEKVDLKKMQGLVSM